MTKAMPHNGPGNPNLQRFQERRAKVLIPKQSSTRHLRRRLQRHMLRAAGTTTAWRGILTVDDRARLARVNARDVQRHNNVMDPFRFKDTRHPQARRLARIARLYATAEAASMGWRIDFDEGGNILFV